MEEEAATQEEAQEEDQVEAQVEAQVETMAEDHLAEDHPAEDHPAEGHQENLLETPQKETNRGGTTLGMMMSLNDEDPDNNPEDDENRSDSPPLRRTEAPSGYNWDQLNSTAWRANSSRAKTPGEGMLEEHNNTFR